MLTALSPAQESAGINCNLLRPTRNETYVIWPGREKSRMLTALSPAQESAGIHTLQFAKAC
jgi:hypothetical protein